MSAQALRTPDTQRARQAPPPDLSTSTAASSEVGSEAPAQSNADMAALLQTKNAASPTQTPQVGATQTMAPAQTGTPAPGQTAQVGPASAQTAQVGPAKPKAKTKAETPYTDKYASKNEDPALQVDRGQLTFDAEGTEGGRYHTRTAHWPGGASGVTIGRGYDLGQNSKKTIEADMATAGISAGTASKFSAAAGKSGQDAKDWLDKNGAGLPEISLGQQEKLFEIVYARLAADVERISTQYAKTMSERTGEDREELEINWSTLHPAIRDLLVDLRYRGDYTPTTRKVVQPLAIANDLDGMAKAMADRSKWSNVPKDRFERRAAYMQEAVAKGKSTVDLSGSAPVASDKTIDKATDKTTEPAATTATTDKTKAAQTEPTKAPVVATPAGGATSKSADGEETGKQKDATTTKAPAGAASNKAYVVTASLLNVRSAPSTTADNKIGTLKSGARLTATGESNGWVSFQYQNQTGWVSSQHLKEAGKEEAGKETPASSGTYALSGAEWVGKANKNGWSNSTSFEDLNSSFGPNVKTFVEGLRSNGANVEITAGLRHKKRAYLMHFAWHVAKGSKTAAAANSACRAEGIDIEWDHGDLKKTQSAAAAMVSTFGLVHAASLTSNHMSGEAMDLKISNVPRKMTIGGKEYSAEKKTRGVMDEDKVDHIGAALGVNWYGPGDWVHWSRTGN